MPSLILGRHKAMLPITPVWTTSATGYLPPKSHLLEGHKTGSQRLNIILHSFGDIKSSHSYWGIATAGLPLKNDLPPTVTIPLPVYCFEASSRYCLARLTIFAASCLSNPENSNSRGIPVCMLNI